MLAEVDELKEKHDAKRVKAKKKGKDSGVIYASLGTRFYLFPPASCFTSAI